MKTREPARLCAGLAGDGQYAGRAPRRHLPHRCNDAVAGPRGPREASVRAL